MGRNGHVDRYAYLAAYSREELEEAANHIAAMHDEMLTRGWTQEYLVTEDEKVCLHGADCAVRIEDWSWETYNKLNARKANSEYFYEGMPRLVFMMLADLIRETDPHFGSNRHLYAWNDSNRRNENEVFDLLRNAEKKLREVAGEK